MKKIKFSSKIGLILLAYIAFISLGLPDGLLGVAWPSIRSNFSLRLDALGILLLAGTMGYLTSSFFSGRIMSRLGVGGLLAASCLVTGASLLGYTLAPAWWVMVVLGVALGLGAGAIDAGLNTYVAAHFSPRFMQWLHASFGVGITLGPMIMTGGLKWFDSWRLGYVLVGSAQIILAASFMLTRAMWQDSKGTVEQAEPQKLTDYRTPLSGTLRQPGAWLSMFLFFNYTGIELTLGHWGYTLLTESRGIPLEIAGLWAGSYWGTFTLGRILAGWYTKHVEPHILMRASILAALGGALLVWWNPTQWSGLVGIMVVGFAVAPIFPGLVSGTSERVTPRHAANTIGMQISAAGLGASVLPAIAGALAQATSLEIIPVFLVVILAMLFTLYSFSIQMAKRANQGERL